MSTIPEVQNLVKKYADEVKMRSSHKNPMYYAAVRNHQWAVCLLAALNNEELPQDVFNALCGNKSKTTTTATVDLKPELTPGVNIMDVLNRHRDIPNLHDNVEECMRELHVHVEGFYVVAD